MQDDVAGHFEQKVTEKENARADAVDGFGKAQIVEHLQLGEAHIHAVEICAEIAQHQKGNEATSDLGIGLRLEAARARIIG
jgi:hypothetical protein